MSAVYVIVPDGFDDPERPSGGNVYDRQVCRGLDAIGWSVHIRAVPPDEAALAGTVAAIPDGAVVVLDGLIASALPDVLVPEARRIREVVLVHMPLDNEKERDVFAAAAAILTTSGWTRNRLVDRYGLPPGRIHVAEPGVDKSALGPGTTAGGEFLCVAAVAPHKGQDVLLKALATIPDLPWRCTFVGPQDPEFGAQLDRQAKEDHIDDRVHYTGPLAGADLDRAYARADALVLASHAETYGMVVTEALARGLPVIATDVGGIPEALGAGTGLLVPPADATALATALRRWLTDPVLRQKLRTAARHRRATLSDWSTTSRRISRVLDEVVE
jgi:glycosyltransferase involved in cell wall biosynthesis